MNFSFQPSVPISLPSTTPHHFITLHTRYTAPTCATTRTKPQPQPSPSQQPSARPRPPTPGPLTTTSSISYLRDVSKLSLLTPSQETELANKVKIFCDLQRAHARLKEIKTQKRRRRQGKDVKIRDEEWAKEAGVGNVVVLRRLWKEGLEARNELVERNLRLVLKISREIWASISWWNDNDGKSRGMGVREDGIGIGFLDLVQEGNFGLLRAAERFDASRGVRFANYAYFHVRLFVQRATAPLGVLIKLPLGVKIALWKVRKFRRLYYMEHGTYPSVNQEAAVVPGRDVRKLREYENVVKSFQSLDAPVMGGEGSMDTGGTKTGLDYLVSEKKQPDQWLDEDFAKNQLRADMKKVLSKRQMEILTMRYGLAGEPPMKAGEIMKKTGLSFNQVTWICKQAKRILRNHLDEALFVELSS